MRIRTLKPEFWISETIAPVSDFAKLLAIGLLNYADDHGYFWANPVLIRAAIFPFHERTNAIEKALLELQKADFIQLGTTRDGRSAGRVTNFAIHQRVDRPKPSLISQITKFDDQSTINQRSVDDGSSLEGKGREGKGTGNDPSGGVRDASANVVDGEAQFFVECKIPGSTVLPVALANSPEFRTAWGHWLEHLRQKRKPATLHAQDLQLRRLAEWGIPRALAAIRLSIEHNWQGIYEDNGNSRNTGRPDRNAGIAGHTPGRAARILAERKAREEAENKPASN